MIHNSHSSSGFDVPVTGLFDVDQDGSITEAEFNAKLLIPWLLSELNNDTLIAQFVDCSKRSSGCNGGLVALRSHEQWLQR